MYIHNYHPGLHTKLCSFLQNIVLHHDFSSFFLLPFLFAEVKGERGGGARERGSEGTVYRFVAFAVYQLMLCAPHFGLNLGGGGGGGGMM